MSTREYREQDYSGSNDPLKDLVLAWMLALVAIAVMSVMLPQ
jgi:hypothetical protein